MRLYEAVWGCMGLYEAVWGFMRLYEALWGCMRLYGAVWGMRLSRFSPTVTRDCQIMTDWCLVTDWCLMQAEDIFAAIDTEKRFPAAICAH